MSLRRAKFILLAATSVGVVYQLSSCVAQTLIQLAGVTFLDFFISPLIGDDCTLLNQTGC